VSTNKRKLTLLAVAGVLTFAMVFSTGCGRKPVMRMNGIAVYEHIWVKSVDRLAPQAAYEMNCSEADLAYVLIKRRGRYPSHIGVEGCGQRVVYQRARRHRWVMVAVEGQQGQPHHPNHVYPQRTYPQQRLPAPQYHPGS